ncbi:polyprenyl synthetase family protein [Pseudoclavibacter chungangensis]|uniref:Polyprenyl synthetase family protein n=1 Tax=Pseudoclavibacter chungangensis TaxID=587635 RepID=A0A7J5BNS5_9MICO|nr:polyprenyl synthetase family protein [Pseudoclavibacter chungangensis]KAB1654074.1 polyprenyl synthetase family protein [Pseudoclavibacter chungangensis]NYJ66014.1 geranylgeranyl diphosphate synthase type II [Pseudoclavibacter chungangensis]
MNALSLIQGTSGQIERELHSIFDAKIARPSAHGADLRFLWEATASRAVGGKLLRPRLFLSTVAALRAPSAGGAPETVERPEFSPSELRVAASLELLHFGFLLHDDVIDDDLSRRGRPNLIALLAATRSTEPARDEESGSRARRLHWAQSCAMLMGSLLIAEVHQIFAAVDADARSDALALLDHAISESVAGELMDVGLSDGMLGADLPTIIRMSEYKTATYSFGLPLQTAAVLAGAPAELGPSLGRAGRHLGLAFQLQDDLLSMFGDPARHGKDAFSDLREGKETALIAYARTTTTWRHIEPWFGVGDLRAADARTASTLLEACGARTFVEGLIAEQLTALDELTARHDAAFPVPLVRVLDGLRDELVGRAA